jgi:hypothetical protein
LTNVGRSGLFLSEEENMASDGDMYAQRKVWGFPKLCAAICDNAPTERLVEIETQNVCNMLGNGFAVPSLKTSIARAHQVLESPHSELGIESAGQRRARLIQTLHGIERDNIAAPSAVDVSKAVQSIGLKFLEAGNDCPSKEDFQNQCCEALGDFWLRRYGWDPFAAYTMSRAHLNPETYRQRGKVARQQAIPKISELIRTAMNSPGGRLSKRKAKRSRPINHTSDGLKEELI